MGMHEYTFVGAYLEVAVDMKDGPDGAKCPECGRGFGFYTDYCRDCGSKLVKSTKQGTPTLYDILPEDEYEDELHQMHTDRDPPGVIFLESNIGGPASELGDKLTQAITPKMISDMKKAFEQKHEDVIKVLKQRSNGVKLQFGVVRYWM